MKLALETASPSQGDSAYIIPVHVTGGSDNFPDTPMVSLGEAKSYIISASEPCP